MGERVCDFHATNRSGLLKGPTPVFDCAISSETCSLHERSERPAGPERRKMGKLIGSLIFYQNASYNSTTIAAQIQSASCCLSSHHLWPNLSPRPNKPTRNTFLTCFPQEVFRETHLRGIFESIHLWRWLVRYNFFAHFLQVPLLWVEQGFLVGGFNPFEKYLSKWESSPNFGVKIKKKWNHHLVFGLSTFSWERSWPASFELVFFIEVSTSSIEQNFAHFFADLYSTCTWCWKTSFVNPSPWIKTHDPRNLT